MRTTSIVSVGLAAVCFIISPTAVRAENHEKAEHEKAGKQGESHAMKSSGKSVSQLIGQQVVNDREENLGKIHDIIVDTGTGKAPYAIIALHSTVSSTQNKIAVPLRELKCPADGKAIQLKATPEALRTANKNLTGEWSGVRDAEWSQKVDGFYGSVATSDQRQVRETDKEAKDSRTFVRDPAPKGGELLITPDDAALADKISEHVDAVQVRVQNGVTHVYGSVPSEQARQELETRIRGVQGVNTLESHLRVRSKP